MKVKTVGIACDHAGFPLKQFVLEYLDKKGYAVKDFGTYSDESVDYPDFAHPLAEAIESGEVYPGIGICGSGEGMAITLNKHQGVRAGSEPHRQGDAARAAGARQPHPPRAGQAPL